MSKLDIQKFISVFGKDTYSEFRNSTARFKSLNLSVDLYYYIKNYSKRELDNLLFNLKHRCSLTDMTSDYTEDAEYLGQTEEYIVYHSTNVRASMNLGINSDWCITGRHRHYGKSVIRAEPERSEPSLELL